MAGSRRLPFHPAEADAGMIEATATTMKIRPSYFVIHDDQISPSMIDCNDHFTIVRTDDVTTRTTRVMV